MKKWPRCLVRGSLMRASIRRALPGAGLIAVLTLALGACGHAAAPTSGGKTPSPSSRPAPSTRSTPLPAPSADNQLSAFSVAAGLADGRLQHAAALVNGDIGATSMRFKPATVAAVREVDIAPVARTIPAGLPAELLRRVLVVYGDLASRSAAFGGVRVIGSSGRTLPMDSQDATDVLRGLRNGAPAAASFDADLAAVHALARQMPPVAIASPHSRAAAELALRLNSIALRNFCSYEFGGWVPESLEPIVWKPSHHPAHYEGTISGIEFEADYTVGHGWQIGIHAC